MTVSTKNQGVKASRPWWETEAAIPLCLRSMHRGLPIGHANQLLELLRLHDEFDVPVTCFVIPCPLLSDRHRLSDDDRMREVISKITAGSSAFSPHAYEHYLFDCRYPKIAATMELGGSLGEALVEHWHLLEAYQEKGPMCRSAEA